MKHFYYYPKIDYSDNTAVNIMVRAKIRDVILRNGALYYKYKVSDGDRPDIIASKYYGNSQYTWAIFYANNILNPQTEWFKDYRNFVSYIKNKYSSIEYTKSTIHHYEYKDAFSDNVYIVDELTYNDYLSEYQINPQTFRTVYPVNIYDYENSLNESKRDIVVLDKGFIFSIDNELSNIFS